MNTTITRTLISNLTYDLRSYLALCEEVLALTQRENRALSGQTDYRPFDFLQARKGLLPKLKEAFISLQSWRQTWHQFSPDERASQVEVKTLFQTAQDMLMKVLLLDRENQQALLRRGLVPAKHLPQVAAQKPHFVASVYKRHSGC